MPTGVVLLGQVATAKEFGRNPIGRGKKRHTNGGLTVVKIAIIGAGIGGLAVALALVQDGFSVDVYERASELVDQGAGVTLAPNATRILFHFGLEDVLLETAVDQKHTDY